MDFFPAANGVSSQLITSSLNSGGVSLIAEHALTLDLTNDGFTYNVVAPSAELQYTATDTGTVINVVCANVAILSASVLSGTVNVVSATACTLAASGWTHTSGDVWTFDASGSTLPQSAVDALLLAFDASTPSGSNSCIGCAINLGGTNAAESAGMSATLTSLGLKGITVTTN
jgi:hypothetical protein